MHELIKVNPVKRTAAGVFLVVVFFLMLFPLVNTLNQFLVNVVEPWIFLKPVQELVIPYEVRIVRAILGWLSVPMTPGEVGVSSITLVNRQGESVPIVVAWNCLGWQSLLIVIATFISGLSGKFTLTSKLEVMLVGLMGTFLLNIGRLTAVFVLFYKGNQSIAMAFHDYGSVLMTLVWLLFFWWFAYGYVLQQSGTIEGRE